MAWRSRALAGCRAVQRVLRAARAGARVAQPRAGVQRTRARGACRGVSAGRCARTGRPLRAWSR
eukprot:1629893-Alexandrium_andersonii.AAC.1